MFAGGGEILRLARPASRSSGSGCEDPLALLLQLALITASGRRRCCSTCGTRSAPATSGWRGRAATATSERRCCRLPPSLMPTTACRLRPVRTTGSPSAGSLWTRACAGWPPRRGPVRSLAEASKTAYSASRGRKPPCRTGPLTLVADLYRRMPAARPGELLAHVSPLGWEHINLTGEYRWPGADPSGTAKRLA